MSLNSSETEYNTLGEDETRSALLWSVLDELGVRQISTRIAQDNAGVNEWAKQGVAKHFIKRKHVQLKMNYQMEGIDSRDI